MHDMIDNKWQKRNEKIKKNVNRYQNKISINAIPFRRNFIQHTPNFFVFKMKY